MSQSDETVRKTPRRRSLYLEFSVAISGIAVIFVMLTINFNLKREMRMLEENRAMRISTLMATFGKLAAQAKAKDDFQLILRAVAEITNDPEISYFLFHDAEGRCVLATKAPLRGEIPQDEVTKKVLASTRPTLIIPYVDEETRTPMLDVSAPVMIGDERIGTIRFGFDSTRHDARVRQMRFENAGLSFASILLAILISFVLARRTMEPIRLLKQKLDSLARGGRIEKVEIDSAEEIQQLADSFNAMTAKWQQLYDELRLAYEELKTLDAMKDRFVSLVSHELRTPLSSIVAAAEVLSEHNTLSEEETREFIGIINTEGKRLTKLATDVLDIAKMKSGKQSYNFQERDINEAVAQATKVAAFAAEAKRQSLTVKLGKDLPHVRIDLDRMVQIVSNLLNNAVRYTQEDGEISISTDKDDGSVVIAVRDNGPGIAPRDQERVFKEFEQAGDMDAHASGTGLGLAICKKLVEVGHNGRIWVESEGEGKGAAFFVAIPIHNEPDEESRDEDEQ